MANRMKFGISMPNAHGRELVQFAVDAERAGWDGFFVWDHLQLDPARSAPTFDPWVLLGAMAARTSRVTLGTLVTPVPRRRPWKLVKEVVTLDQLSDGRAVLGVGLGVPQQTEYAVFGEPAEPRAHAAKLDEALPIMDRWLRGEPVDHHGEHYRVAAQLAPGPIQRPRPPIWVAAMLPARAGVRRARKWDGIFPQHRDTGALTSDQLSGLVAELDCGSDFEIVTHFGAGVPADELADVGATWAIAGPGREDSLETVRDRLLPGPPALR